MSTVAATGHRQPGRSDLNTRRALSALAAEWLRREQPSRVIVGMAIGWDQAVAAAAVLTGIPFTAAIPLPGQERKWPQVAQDRYHRLLRQADEVVLVTTMEGDDILPVREAMMRRNRWMLDRADRVLALYDGSLGGTRNALKYAVNKGLPIDNLWDRWTLKDDIMELLG